MEKGDAIALFFCAPPFRGGTKAPNEGRFPCIPTIFPRGRLTGHLACISHQLSTAAPQSVMPAALRSVGRLATKPGEKCRLGLLVIMALTLSFTLVLRPESENWLESIETPVAAGSRAGIT